MIENKCCWILDFAFDMSCNMLQHFSLLLRYHLLSSSPLSLLLYIVHFNYLRLFKSSSLSLSLSSSLSSSSVLIVVFVYRCRHLGHLVQSVIYNIDNHRVELTLSPPRKKRVWGEKIGWPFAI